MELITFSRTDPVMFLTRPVYRTIYKERVPVTGLCKHVALCQHELTTARLTR